MIFAGWREPKPRTMAESTADESITVTVAYALPTKAWVIAVKLADGATAMDALACAGFASSIPGFDPETLGFAVFGNLINSATVLHDGDRLELLRPLIADPKQARRQRALSTAAKPKRLRSGRVRSPTQPERE